MQTALHRNAYNSGYMPAWIYSNALQELVLRCHNLDWIMYLLCSLASVMLYNTEREQDIMNITQLEFNILF